MKLRLNRRSIRFRLLRSEVARLVACGRVAETIYFGDEAQARFTYVLAVERVEAVYLRYSSSEIAIVLPSAVAALWASTDQVGVYARVPIGTRGEIDLVIEKDFACLDLSDADNCDTFPNPQFGAVC